ncbi:BTAD domain-containing putative transcriptional regulator [Streptomyces clavuligerus]|uniref:BTAD domain-containing putative transcriptional regulator n=1 Tax=Streptomyces clavuligerus TaxID=1901 RepID=UPI0027DA3E99|nr:BTAD domain-containing putative transcriptional regulator [Streptomyces clavuligerus]
MLGPLSVLTADHRPVRVPEQKIRALLADLLAHDGRPVSTDRLVQDLWGDTPPANPVGALQIKVSRLRRVLEEAEPGGRELVVSLATGYALEAAGHSVDAARFEALVERGRAAPDPRERADLLTEALGLWRGAAFSDFAHEVHLQPAIARLEEQRLSTLEERAEALLALDGHQALTGELGELVGLHPLRERLRASYMLALYRSGRQADALTAYEELRQLLVAELGLDPGADIVALHGAILRQDPALDGAPGPVPGPARPRRAGNLPAPLTALVGRETAVAEVRALLAAGRLVTLTGPGGVGKTRLALETAARIPDAFADGVWLVELAPLGAPGVPATAESVAQAVMAVLGVREATTAEYGAGASPAGRLADFLAAKRLLLVLDNCEHLVESVAALARDVLVAAPGLRILATSREPLRLAGEVLWPVPPLELPGPEDDHRPEVLERCSAVQLFVARAGDGLPGFALSLDNAAAVAAVCRRLDGIPLALELAATRIRALGVAGLLARLDDRFRLLATGYRGAEPRQQTLRAMIDWSWELLSGPERTVLRRLAVHADGCTLEAAEEVCGGDGGVAAEDVLMLLAHLVDRSLVVAADTAEGPRYRLLESVAEYCRERLREAGDTGPVLRHRRHYRQLAERVGGLLVTGEQRRWLELLDVEHGNLRVALAGAVREAAAGTEGADEEALRFAGALAWYWFLRGRLREGLSHLGMALDATAGLPGGPAGGGAGPDGADPVAGGGSAARAVALAWHAGFMALSGDTADDGPRRRAAEALGQGGDAPVDRARARWFLGFVECDFGDLALSEELVGSALDTFEELGDRWGTAAALGTRAKHAMVRGDLAALRRDGERSAALFQEIGDRWGHLQATDALGNLAEIAGHYDAAAELHWTGLRTAQELGLWSEVSSRLSWLGRVAMLTGEFEQARELHERGIHLAREHGFKPGEIFGEMGLGIAARKAGKLDIAETRLRRVLEWLPRERSGRGDTLPLALILPELGFVAEQRGDVRAALELHLEGLEVGRRLAGDPRGTVLALEGLAGAHARLGRHERAARLLGAAAAARKSANAPTAPAERGDVERVTAQVRSAVGQETYEREHTAGGNADLGELYSAASTLLPEA